MDSDDFQNSCKRMIDYVAKYCETLRARPLVANVAPGYLRALIPQEAPQKPEDFDEVLKDIERVIMPGITHWNHPRFFGFFPTGHSWPCVAADILSDGIACIGFNWTASPAYTELEINMMDWLAKLLKLPEAFLSSANSGGVIQGSASESTLICMLAARNKAIIEKKTSSTTAAVSTVVPTDDTIDETYSIMSKLTVYFSEQAHSSVERAALLNMMRYRKLKADQNQSLRGAQFEAAIKKDMDKGLIPCYLVVTLGTTSSCAFDDLQELGMVAEKYNIWVHVDAAYAGSAFICPEYRHLLNGVEYVSSFNFNPHKWLSVNHDCSALWLRESKYLTDAFTVSPHYLTADQTEEVQTKDLRHWQIPLGRRFRSLKLWFVLRCFGTERLQDQIRQQVALAKEFEKLIRANEKFEIVGKVTLALACFRLKGENALSQSLYSKICKDSRIYLTPSVLELDDGHVFFLRFVVGSLQTNAEDVKFAYNVISELADEVLTAAT